MLRARRALSRFVFACCLCQITGMTVGPTILLALGTEALECRCVHGDHALCPMHHPRSGTRQCAMVMTSDGVDGAAVSFPGLADLVIPSADVVAPDVMGTVSQPAPAPILARPAFPDPRPPRQ